MTRPEFVSNEDILRWSEKIDNDPLVPPELVEHPLIREVCYAGQWLNEKLVELDCQDDIIGRIMYTAGAICYGRPDPWIIHQNILQKFIEGTLEFENNSNSN